MIFRTVALSGVFMVLQAVCNLFGRVASGIGSHVAEPAADVVVRLAVFGLLMIAVGMVGYGWECKGQRR